jgi:hypothetical protein
MVMRGVWPVSTKPTEGTGKVGGKRVGIGEQSTKIGESAEWNDGNRCTKIVVGRGGRVGPRRVNKRDEEEGEGNRRKVVCETGEEGIAA